MSDQRKVPDTWREAETLDREREQARRPPSLTREEVERRVDEAIRRDREQEAQK